MFSGPQSVKFAFDRCPKKQNNTTSNFQISFPHIFHKGSPEMSKHAFKCFYLCFAHFGVTFWHKQDRIWQLLIPRFTNKSLDENFTTCTRRYTPRVGHEKLPFSSNTLVFPKLFGQLHWSSRAALMVQCMSIF